MSDLKSQVVSGLKWSVLAKAATQAFSWISTFLVIRMLTPDDYGIMAIAMVFFTFIAMFTTNGLTSALVRRQDRDQHSANLIFTLSIALNLLLSGTIAWAAPYIATWYNNPDLTMVLWVLAAINPLTSLIVVPTAHLQMEMRFKEKALAESAAGLSGAITAFVAAYAGMAYWALILSSVVMSVVRVAAYNWVARSRYKITFDFHGAKDLFGFAIHIQLGTFVWFAYNKADTILIGRFLGVDKAGIYNVASEVASIPMSKVNSIMNEVAFSAFTKTQDDIEAAKRYLTKALKLMAVIAFPMFYGISAVADEMVAILMGEKWVAAGPVIMVLCWVLPFRMLVSVMGNFASGLGHAKFNLHNALVTAGLLITSISIGAQYGLVETAIAWVSGFVMVYTFLLIRYHKKFRMAFSDMLVYWPVLMVSLVMFFSIKALEVYASPLLESPLDIGWIFAIKILVGVILAGPALLFGYGSELRSLLKR